MRLGEDVFVNGYVSPEKAELVVDTMIAFKHLLRVHGTVGHRACATSAMRNATNSEDIVERVAERASIDIEVIHGRTEADIIFSNHVEEQLDRGRSYLYIDVGGGSTELTIFSNNRPITSRSFRIGTIRLLQGKVEPEYWDRLFGWIKENTGGMKQMDGIGSGGNINKIYKMASIKNGQPLTITRLKRMHTVLSAMTYEERVMRLGLNLDRADVIIPAGEIFLRIAKTAGIKEIIVPQFGLSDGMTRLLYEQFIKDRK